jgi:hypothetical protein
LLLLALMALARVKNIEWLRYTLPGEWGKLLGLDRIPEVRTLRSKVRLLTEDGQAQQWSGALSRDWMAMFPETTGVLYIDGHVRVYHGSQTELPRHYVARQQLCLRATTDYWVNAMDGQPFFMVNQPVDPGLLSVLEEEIVPRLERELPHQPDLSDSTAPRFTLVFDREGYSPDFMARMLAKGIACLSYHKYPGDDWPAAEFTPRTVTLVSGQDEEMPLAERATLPAKNSRCARSANSAQAVIKRQSSPPISGGRSPIAPRPCSPAGARKTFSGTCANIITSMAWPTTAPAVFLAAHGWSIPSIGSWTAR